jgi:hypothetical protein
LNSPTSTVFGQTINFSGTANNTGGGAAASGDTIQILNGATVIGSGTLTGAASPFAYTFNVTTPNLPVSGSPFSLVAHDNTNSITDSTAVTQTVSQASTTTSDVSSSLNPAVYGQTVTLTATIAAVAPGAGTPTGTVTFSDQVGTLGTGALNGSGVATFTSTTISAGVHTVTASYGGDTNFTTSNDTGSATPLKETINQSSSSTSDVSSSVNPGAFGQTVTFSATVSAVAPGGGNPTGTVSFKEGATTLGTGALAAGLATFTSASLTAGTHIITATYPGDANFTASNDTASSTKLQQEITLAGTTTTDVTSSLTSPYTFGTANTYTVTINVTAPGGGTPTGSVTFKDQSGNLGTGTVNGTGVATFSTASVSVGTHTITASYGGDANFSSSNDSASATPLKQTVTQSSSSTAVSVPAGTVYFGSSMTYTATVTNTGPGTTSPTGSVTFTVLNGTTVITGGSGTLSASGAGQSQAKFVTLASMGGITQTIKASYGGDINFSSSGPVTNSSTITAAVTKTTVSVTANNGFFGTSWSPIAHVSVVPGKGAGTPGSSSLGAAGAGKVVFTATIVTNASASNTFLLGGTFTQTLGTVSVNTNGGALLAHPILPGNLTVFNSSGVATPITTAAYTVTAAFTATGADFASSPASAGVVENVNGNVTTFTQISASPVSPQVGQKVTLTASITATGGSLFQPLGSVTFKDTFGGVTTALATVTLPVAQVLGLVKVTATFTTTTLAKGSHALTTVYNPDATTLAPDFTSGTGFTSFATPIRGQWLTSTSSIFNEVVKPITTFGSLVANPSTTTAGHTVTFTDTVTSGTGAIPTGLVRFLDGATTLGSSSLNASGKATFTTSSLTAGSHAISAVYNAGGNFAGDTSNTVNYMVSNAVTMTHITGASSQMITLGTRVDTATSPRSTTTPLAASSVDGYFASTTKTHQTLRMLAGALAKVHSGEDWLGASF